jgi:hypothetical protein
MTWASVVLPVPGGPQKIAEDKRSDSTSTRKGRPRPTSSSWPTMSSSDRGRSRAASGACLASLSSAAAAKRSSPTGPDVRGIVGEGIGVGGRESPIIVPVPRVVATPIATP